MTIIGVPATFASDHTDRELPSGTFIEQKGHLWFFDCTDEEIAEWISDATYYSDCAGQGWDFGTRGEQLGLQSSARATVKRLRGLVPPGTEPAK